MIKHASELEAKRNHVNLVYKKRGKNMTRYTLFHSEAPNIFTTGRKYPEDVLVLLAKNVLQMRAFGELEDMFEWILSNCFRVFSARPQNNNYAMGEFSAFVIYNEAGYLVADDSIRIQVNTVYRGTDKEITSNAREALSAYFSDRFAEWRAKHRTKYPRVYGSD
jgi:hypothetical protein